jgi:hypothetical protein
MDRRKKEIAGLAISAIALVPMAVLMFSMMCASPGYSSFVGVVMIILAVMGLSGLHIVITFSHSRWEVEGSALEWVLAAATSPFSTPMFYTLGRFNKENEGDRIDPAGQRRMDQL